MRDEGRGGRGGELVHGREWFRERGGRVWRGGGKNMVEEKKV